MNPNREENAAVLRRIGITDESVIEKLAATPGLTPLGIALMAVEGEQENARARMRRKLQQGLQANHE